MVEAVAEVVDVVSLDGVLAVVDSALPGAFARASEVSLESGRARVQYTDAVRVVRPRLPERLLERRVELLERVSLRLACDVHLPKLLVRDVAREHTLDHVGSVQAVHAVGPHVAHLPVCHLGRSLVHFLTAVHTELHVGHEVVEGVEFVLDLVDEFGQVLPLHFAALVVEVEPDVLDESVAHPVHDLREGGADAELRALLVDEVDEDLLAIRSLDLGHVLLRETQRLIGVLVDAHRRTPLHSRLLTPQRRNRTPRLHIRGNAHAIALFVESDNVLGLHEVGHVPVSVDATHDETPAWPSAVLLRDESEIEALRGVDHQRLDIEIAKDTGDFERGIRKVLEVLQKVVVEDEVWRVAHSVGILLGQVCHH